MTIHSVSTASGLELEMNLEAKSREEDGADTRAQDVTATDKYCHLSSKLLTFAPLRDKIWNSIADRVHKIEIQSIN